MVIIAKENALRATGDENNWDYGVFIYSSTDVCSGYLFFQKRHIGYDFGFDLAAFFEILKEFKQADYAQTRKRWVKCKIAIANQGKKIEMRFEYEDKDKWKITPGNQHKRYEIILEDIYPEAIRPPSKTKHFFRSVGRLFDIGK